MEIISFEASMADGVAKCYNELIEPLQFCYPIPVERFASVEALGHKLVRDEEIVVARRDGEVIGFAHVGIALPPRNENELQGEPAVIRCLAYRAGERRVGQGLLEWVETWAKEREREAVYAWHAGYRYPFYYFEWAHLSVQIGHVRALLGANGYEEHDSEIYMVWRDFGGLDLSMPEVEFEIIPAWDGRWLTVKAMQAGERIGFCDMHRRLPSPAPDADDWCHCDWLWVADRLRGKRLGVYLLVRGMREMREVGCKHATISTNMTNYRAQLMYTNMGYRVTDTTVALRKRLRE